MGATTSGFSSFHSGHVTLQALYLLSCAPGTWTGFPILKNKFNYQIWSSIGLHTVFQLHELTLWLDIQYSCVGGGHIQITVIDTQQIRVIFLLHYISYSLWKLRKFPDRQPDKTSELSSVNSFVRSWWPMATQEILSPANCAFLGSK